MFWSWWNFLPIPGAFSVIFLFWCDLFFFSWYWFIIMTTLTVFLILFTESIYIMIVRRCDAVYEIFRILLFQIKEYWAIVITLLCLFMIFYFRFVRVTKKSFKLIIFIGIKFGWVDNKFFKAIIFSKLELRLSLLFTETIFSFEWIRVPKRRLFSSGWLKIIEAFNMIGLIRWVLIIIIISV